MAAIGDLDIQSIVFGPEAIEITYIEERDVDKGSGIVDIRTRSIPFNLCEAERDELLDSVLQYLDAAAVVRRNPRPTIGR